MMKFFYVLVLTVFSLGVQAQELLEGNLAFIKELGAIGVEWDFSKTQFEGKYDEQSFLEFTETAVDEWEDEVKPEVLDEFIKAANEKLTNVKVFFRKSTGKEAVVLYMAPDVVTRKGKNTTRYVFADRATGKVLALVSYSCFGGTFGTLTNLMSDGYRFAGKKLGAYINKQARKK